MLFTSSCLVDFIGVLIALGVVLVGYLKWHFKYWNRKGVTCETPTAPFGNMSGLFLGNETIADSFARPYKHLRQLNLPFGGAFMGTKKVFVPTDPELIKNIMQKDFNHFMNHGGYVDEEVDPLTGHLFSLEDEKWKNLRQKLTPTFTSGKMKMMFQTLADVAENLKEVMDESAKTATPVDIKEVLGCFSTDIIGSCAFGIECNSLQNPDNEFRKYGKLAFEASFTEMLRNLVALTVPRKILHALKFKAVKPEITDFMIDMTRKTVEYREKNNIYRKDFMHLLIQLKNMGKLSDDEKISDGSIGEHGLTMNEVAAQAFVFFLAGFETSSTTMTFAFYELALNLDIQRKLRQEIKTVLAKTNGKLTYDAIMDMKYMDQVINETLRKYPPVPVHLRECNKDYLVPGSNVTVEKGTTVGISCYGLHYDHEYFPNPVVFDPERFTEENKASRPNYTYLPFGEGPRICIGLRFGLMQTKVGMATLLHNYEVSLNRKTSTPLVFDKGSFILAAQGGVWLNIKKITT